MKKKERIEQLETSLARALERLVTLEEAFKDLQQEIAKLSSGRVYKVTPTPIREIDMVPVTAAYGMPPSWENPFAEVSVPLSTPREPLYDNSTFDLFLTSVGNSKIEVMRVIRNATGDNPLKVKSIVDNIPGVIKKDISKFEAEEIAFKLESLGATVELKPTGSEKIDDHV